MSSSKENNAAYLAETPCLDNLFSRYPNTQLEASGPAVGLPEGQNGNSEVGHMTMGCGCVMEQDLVRINYAIKDKSFFQNTALIHAMQRAQSANAPLHLLGLVSDGGVHSHIDHLDALIHMCQHYAVKPLLHMITDGRDTMPACAQDYIERIEQSLAKAGGAIVTVMGRFYAMDRDHRWERTQLAWNAIALRQGKKAPTASMAIEQSYRLEDKDEFILPTVLPVKYRTDENMHMVLFNFRNDRPRQLIESLLLRDFKQFERPIECSVEMLTITEIDEDLPCAVAFDARRPSTTLSQTISRAQLKQFHCAETEKYPHVTFFFNGGREKPFPGETRCLIDSPKVFTYDLCPEMSAKGVADSVIDAINSGQYDFIVVNFANADMVGHTAQREAVIKSVEVVDEQIGRLVDAVLAKDFYMVLTSDHGNCDEMVDEKTQQPHTKHTCNPVPLLVIGNNLPPDIHLASGGNISCVTPTVLDLMGLEIPPEMESCSALSHNK